MTSKFPRPLLSSPILHFSPLWATHEEGVVRPAQLKKALAPFKVSSVTRVTGKENEWDIEFADSDEAEAALIILQSTLIPNAKPACRFRLEGSLILYKWDESVATLPQFFRTDNPFPRNAREVYELLRPFGPLQRLDMNANLGRKLPAVVVHFYDRGNAIGAERYTEKKHTELGKLQAFDPCGISCFRLGASFKQSDFEAHFGTYGDIVNSVLVKGGTSEACGFVDFSTPEQATSALFMNGMVLRNSRVTVRINEKKSLVPPKHSPKRKRTKRESSAKPGPPPPSPPPSPPFNVDEQENDPPPGYSEPDTTFSRTANDASYDQSNPRDAAAAQFAALAKAARQRLERARASLREMQNLLDAAQAEEARARAAREAAERLKADATREADEALRTWDVFEAAAINFASDKATEDNPPSSEPDLPESEQEAVEAIRLLAERHALEEAARQEAARRRAAQEAEARERAEREKMLAESRRKMQELNALEAIWKKEETEKKARLAEEERLARKAAQMAKEEEERRIREEKEREEREERERVLRAEREERERVLRAEREERERVARAERERIEKEERERQQALQRVDQHRQAAVKESNRCRQRDTTRWPRNAQWNARRALERFILVSQEFDDIKFSEAQPLTSMSVPWPVLLPPHDLKVEEVEWSMVESFFAAIERLIPATQYKSLVEKAHKRFHPDRWRSRGICLTVFDNQERAKIENAGNVVAQAITPLWLKTRT